MADTKASAFAAASDLVGADVPVVQGGANKKAGVALFDARFAAAGHDHSGVYQPLDADLTALAGQTIAADKMLYGTGAGTWGQASAGAVGRAILASTSSSSDPTVDDDSGDGYGVGTIWVNTATQELFECTDATAGAAVWIALQRFPDRFGHIVGRYYPAGIGTEGANYVIAVTENRAYCGTISFLRRTNLAKLGIRTTTGSTNANTECSFALYRSDGAGGTPGTLVEDYDKLAVGTTANSGIEKTLSAKYAPPGTHWLCVLFNANGGTWNAPTLRGCTRGGGRYNVFGHVNNDFAGNMGGGARADLTVSSWASFGWPTTFTPTAVPVDEVVAQPYFIA